MIYQQHDKQDSYSIVNNHDQLNKPSASILGINKVPTSSYGRSGASPPNPCTMSLNSLVGD